MPNPIATALTIYNSAKYIKNGLKAFSECKLNVDVLDSASIVACFARKNFKTASTVMFLLSISGLLEKYTRERTKAVLTDSLVIKTDKVWLVTSGEDVEIPITELQVGDKSVFIQVMLSLLTVLLQMVKLQLMRHLLQVNLYR